MKLKPMDKLCCYIFEEITDAGWMKVNPRTKNTTNVVQLGSSQLGSQPRPTVYRRSRFQFIPSFLPLRLSSTKHLSLTKEVADPIGTLSYEGRSNSMQPFLFFDRADPYRIPVSASPQQYLQDSFRYENIRTVLSHSSWLVPGADFPGECGLTSSFSRTERFS